MQLIRSQRFIVPSVAPSQLKGETIACLHFYIQHFVSLSSLEIRSTAC